MSSCRRSGNNFSEISQPAVSQHLAILKRAGPVDAAKIGTMIYYRINVEGFEELLSALGALRRGKDDQFGDGFSRPFSYAGAYGVGI